MKKSFVLSAAAAAFLIALIAFIPASVIEGTVNQRLAPMARLQMTGGTIWSGSGTLVPGVSGRRGQDGQDAQFEIPLKWSFAPASILRLRIGADVVASGRQLNGTTTAEAGLFDLQLRNTDIKISMEFLARIRRELSIIKPSGELQLTSANHALAIDYASPHAMAGRMNFAATQVRVRSIGGLPISAPLGSYSGNLVFEGQRVTYQIEKSTGILALNGGGHVVLGKTNEFRYQGFAAALPGSPVWVAGVLGSFGRLSPDGRVNIDYKTNW